MEFTLAELKVIQKDVFPRSTFLTVADLRSLHNNSDVIASSIASLAYDDLPAVAYYLPGNLYGFTKRQCCNGLRFGKDGDYISLPHLSERVIQAFFRSKNDG